MEAIIYYRLATADDVEALTSLRLAFLAEISGTDASDPGLQSAIAEYFLQSITTGKFTAFLAVANSRIVAGSGLTFHQHPPSNRNPTGREAYIMNMYTVPEFRRRGIATRLVQMLVDEARQNDCGKISLHVLPDGRSIYANAGFEPIGTEMRLNLLK